MFSQWLTRDVCVYDTQKTLAVTIQKFFLKFTSIYPVNRFINWMRYFTIFTPTKLLFVTAVVTFPIYCPVYERILPDVIYWFNSHNLFMDMHRWALWIFIKSPGLWSLYIFGNDMSPVTNYFFSLFNSPLDSALYLENMREYFYYHKWDLNRYYIRTVLPVTGVFFTKFHYIGFFLFNFFFGDMTLASIQITQICQNLKLPTVLTSEHIFGFFTFGGVFFVVNVVFSLILISFLGLYGVFMITSISLFIFWVSCLLATHHVWNNNITHVIDFGRWFYLHNDVAVHFDFYLDNLSMAFALLVLTIAFFINIYTFAYFRYEPNVSRLILFIDLFVISMVIMVLAANFVVLYFGWEMVGITSFFLINFWATRMGTLKASFKAFVFNKVSDCFMLIALIIFVTVVSDINIMVINEVIGLHTQTNVNTLNTVFSTTECLGFCLMIAAFIKSAQFGFHIWLPDSMEAPVPASALIHSATLVSAGIFLILRFYPLFELVPFIKNCILLSGSFTAFFGGLCSVFQTDVKRLLAYSTISHCGVLMFLTFFKNPDLVIIYLYVHGFFKAIIFMCMGHVIRFGNNHQDMRRMGGFYKYLPFETMLSFIALWNLGGVAFSWGFYMKHFLLLDGSPESFFNLMCFVFVLIGSLTGLLYSYKLFYYTFFDFKKGRKNVYMKIPNNQTNNEYFTYASLASNVSILLLTISAYFLCGFLIHKYLSDNSIYFDWSYFSNVKNNLKNYNVEYLLNIYFFINWAIVLIIVFLLFNNWKNNLNVSFKLKFFIFCWTFTFFFYLFYAIFFNYPKFTPTSVIFIILCEGVL